MGLQSRGNRGDVMYSYTYRIPKPWNGFFIIKKEPFVIFVLPGLHIEKSSAWRVNFLCLCVEDLDRDPLKKIRLFQVFKDGAMIWKAWGFSCLADKDSHTHSVLLKATKRMLVCQQNAFETFELHRHESLPRLSLTEGFFLTMKLKIKVNDT